MRIEHYEKWKPIEGITTPAAYALLHEDQGGLIVTLAFSGMADGLDSDLQINFGRVAAYTVHEEFSHPSMRYDAEPRPRLSDKWKGFCFPTLIVKESVWLNSFSDSQLIAYPGCTHYQLVTLDETVDVLCNREPKVKWVEPPRELA